MPRSPRQAQSGNGLSNPRAAWLDRLPLVVGVLSALTLAAAAFSDVADPAVAGRHALVVGVSDLSEAVTGEWRRFSSLANKDTFETSADSPATLARSPVEAPIPNDLTASEPSTSNQSARTLMRDAAERANKQDLAGSVNAALDAILKATHPGVRARARILACTLAGQAERIDVLREQMEAARDEFAWSDAIGDTSARLLIHILCIEHGDTNLKEEARREAVEAWWRGSMALPSPLAMTRRNSSGALVADVTPEARILAHRLAFENGDLPPLLTEAIEDARARALLDSLGLAPDDVQHTTFTRVEDDVLLAVRADTADTSLFAITRPELISAFRRFLRAQQIPGEGFALDFNGDPATEGELLRQEAPLGGIDLGFAIRHPDPDAFRADPGQRAQLLRTALLAMAVFSFMAGLATHAATVRRRKLQVLQSTFIANTSHELRTPLSSILLMAENLENGVVQSEEGLQRYHALIRQEASRLRRLVDDVLDFARHERGAELSLTFQPVTSQRLFERAEQIARERAEVSNTEVEVRQVSPAHPSESPPTPDLVLSADLEALLRCVANLVENAFVHGGGKAVVVFESRVSELRISVSDQGPGIPAAHRESIFRPFVRLDADAGRGTGLGLTIVQAIMRAHEGSIEARNGTDGGAEFLLRLPWIDAELSSSDPTTITAEDRLAPPGKSVAGEPQE